MQLKKAPLAVAIAAAIALSSQAQADTTIVINDYRNSGVEIIDQSIDGTLDIDIQQGQLNDGVVIYNSQAANALIENNQGSIYAGEPGGADDDPEFGNIPVGNTGILILDSDLTGVDLEDEDAPKEVTKLILDNIGGDIQASQLNDDDSDQDYDAPAVGILNSTVTGTIVNDSYGSNGGSIEGANGIRIDQSTFTGSIYNEDDVNISQAYIDSILAIEDSLDNPPEGYDAELEPISVIWGEVAGIDIRNSEMNGSIHNSGHIQGGENAIKLTRNATMTGDIVNSGTIKAEQYSAIYLRDSELNGSIINLAESDENGAGEITSEYGASVYVQRSDVNGDIVNESIISGRWGGVIVDGTLSEEQYTEQEDGSYSYSEAESANGNKLTGNIINRGSIRGGEVGIAVVAADMEGDIVNEGLVRGYDGIYIESGYELEASGAYDASTDAHSGQYTDTTITTTLTGNITNAQSGRINAYDTGISLDGADLQGSIENAGNITTVWGDGIAIVGGYSESGEWSNEGDSSTWETTLTNIQGAISNSGEIDAGGDGIYLDSVELEGDINNAGDILARDGDGIAVYGGYEGSETYAPATDGDEYNGAETPIFASITGDINNTGRIDAGWDGIYLSGTHVTGNINNTGAIAANEDGIALRGGYTYEWQSSPNNSNDVETPIAAQFNGDINNSGSIAALENGIDIRDNEFNGAINNTGTIEAGAYGIRIDDSVTGNLVINQSGGSITAPTAIRMNDVTQVNYTGGAINGDVNNLGGIFYVEGNRTITGNYAQSAEATLALGLHTESSLTANSITLTEGSRVLLDLSSGSLYLGSGEHTVELVKVNGGELIASDIIVETTSSLVEIASWTLNENGNLELVIDNTSLTEVANLVSGSGNQIGQQAGNSAALAAAIDALGDGETDAETALFLNELIELFQSNDPEALADTLNKLLPDVTGSVAGSAKSTSTLSNGQVSVRARSLASGDSFTKTGVWVQGLAANAEQETRNGIAGYDADTHGFVFGVDGELHSGAVIGAAYSFTNIDSDSATSSSETDYHMLTGYVGQSYGNVLLDGQVYYAWGDNSSSRSIGASADFDSALYGARIGAGYQVDLSQSAQFIPTLSLDYSRLSVDGYTETGTGALSIDKQDYDRLELGVAAELNNTYQINQTLVTPRLTLGVYHDFEAEAQSVTAAFAAAPTSTFTIAGADPEKTRYTAGLGLELVKGEGFSADLEYNYNWQDDFDAHAGAVKLRWEF